MHMASTVRVVSIAAIAAAVVVGRPVSGQNADRARTLIERAAGALGGLERVRDIRNITLTGYAQYAYQFGGGRITGESFAPEKYIAANDLRRVYDLEHNRFQLTERRNMLFPFLGPFGHSWAPVNQVLDGDLAYDVVGEKTVRVGRESESPLQVDGVHVRRMLMMTNPVVVVRAMLEPGTRLSAPRRQTGSTTIDVTLKEGDKLTAAFASNGVPVWIRWSSRHTNVGQMNFTTSFSGWSDATGTSGILLPLAYETRLSYRNVDYVKLYVDAYQLDTTLPDLAATDVVRQSPEPPSYPVPTITSQRIGNGVWRVDQGGTTIVEFRDHLVLFELGVNVATAKAVIAHARTLAPGKPVTHLVASHNHFDHTAGLRQAVAEGLTIVQRRGSEPQFRDMVAHAAPDYPDDLARNRKPLKFLAVNEHLRMSDDTQTLDIYWVGNNAHMADVLVGYVPSERLLMEGDLVTAAFDWQHWPDGFRDVVGKYALNVERISGVHPVGLAKGQATLTRAQAEDLLRGGTERAREHCKAELAKGNAHPGCPVQSKYY
jgi:glyoxylase-like metal-dependent hydrolase (beta-lactamase superfamily II)